MWWNSWVRVRIFPDSNSFFYNSLIPLILKVVFWIYPLRNVQRERDSDLVSTLSTEGSPLIFGDGGGAQSYFWGLQSKVKVHHEKFQFLLDFFRGGTFGDLNPMPKFKMRHFNLIWEGVITFQTQVWNKYQTFDKKFLQVDRLHTTVCKNQLNRTLCVCHGLQLVQCPVCRNPLDWDN